MTLADLSLYLSREYAALLIYPLTTIVTFLAVFLKGFQYKNVIGNHKNSIVITSFLMAAFDIVSITLAVKGGLWMIPFVGTGAAVGMLGSVTLHDRIFKNDISKTSN